MPQLVTLMSYVAEAAKSPASVPEADHKGAHT